MKTTFYILLLMISALIPAQVVKDLDGDGIRDSVTFNKENSVITCRLSTQNFRKIIGILENNGDNAEINATKSGFQVAVNYMRSGYALQFRYDKKSQKIQLIGMSRYEFGPASNDGSGNSSVNLLTGDYVADWNCYDMERERLIKIPTIKGKMNLPATYIGDDIEKIFDKYEEEDAKIFAKKKLQTLALLHKHQEH